MQPINLELTAIYEISKLLNSSLDLEYSFRGVLKLLATYFGMERGMVILGRDETLRALAWLGFPQEQLGPDRMAGAGPVVRYIQKTGFPTAVPDETQEPLLASYVSGFPRRKGPPISFLGIPILHDRECLGVLILERRSAGASARLREDTRLLQLIAALMGQTIRLRDKVAEERHRLVAERDRLQTELATKHRIENVVGQSKRMQEVIALTHQVAPTRSTVLLRGESGTGKEAIARALHFLSPRKNGPFIKLNCAALPESLLESELFGHEKGAFTGALHERKGRFELAHGGTLFLDEIGDISPAVQVKLLRVLQEREFERLGGSRTIHIDVRLITATNKNLEEAVLKGEFRSDLYYRINVVSIFLPPLRERADDIPLLVEYFLKKMEDDFGKQLSISSRALDVLVRCHWPGNVRELQNCLERAANSAPSGLIDGSSIACQHNQCPSSLLWKHELTPVSTPVVTLPIPAEKNGLEKESLVRSPTGAREQLLEAMERCGWVQAKAARLLHLTPRQLGYALRKYEIPIKKF
ncbi:nif-specific transcriptional activator NifA [Methylacidimicrobium tartarophylax]|uniref:Nif-specific regulatory protein n=1 Tax=Methylacidimicrobium tartarophylax TaxID=1041768 RepID=A0A5E6MGF8_9BACT|nr:nif-specific transcriptional activator NifA [Methylacidimicrobium tartarophylax]VVM08102.1 Nif-specific regulatory protein [Methylacidimicrobium tartarophylax]